jgi:hypothetical protein
MECVDKDIFRVETPLCVCLVDTDTPLEVGGYYVDVSPTWRHTKEEYAAMIGLANHAVEDYVTLVNMARIIPRI